MQKFRNFSESGSRAITAAINIAGKMGHITVGTEHMLMGILSCGKSDAADLLAEYDINFACVYNVALNVLGCGQPTRLTEEDFSTNAVLVLKNAYNKATVNGKTFAGVNEILCSISSSDSCMAYQIISTLTKNSPDFYKKAEQLCIRKGTAGFSTTAKGRKEHRILDKYSKNLTEMARLAPFDPCIGRENEIRQLTEIILRRQKNNPCLVGLAGVGKTAIVEGLANLIARGNVPDAMKSKSIYSLDMAWLLAGTKYRGDFEERIKSVMDDAASDKDVILFIDEIHTIVSAGGAEGAIDAANIMKPALARGAVQIIGATTRDEYARTIEKDAALERRFSPVEVQEPTSAQAVEILAGLKDRYEEYHNLSIDDTAIQASVELSIKHIINRFLPDKAVDILDQSCASARVAGNTTVTENDVIQVISRRTGISPAQMCSPRSQPFEELLAERITGQQKAVTAMANAIRRWRAGLQDPDRPVATFIFCGPTGVGKTHSCKMLAELLFPGENALVRIDCTEYSEKSAISRLTGSSPGYVGYDDGGILEKEMLARNRSVVLFDEIEKAHTDLHNLLLQAMDTGFITTSRGKKISFKNSIIVMTSNIGADLLDKKEMLLGFEKTAEISAEDNVKNAVKAHFSPEFIGRIDEIVVFEKLTQRQLQQIACRHMETTAKRLEKLGITVEYDSNVICFICRKATGSTSGARNIRSAISTFVYAPVSDMIVTGRLKAGCNCLLVCDGDKISVKIYEKV